VDLTRLSLQMAYVLRHTPWEYELEPDDEGWVSLEHLLEGLLAEPGFSEVTKADIEAVNRLSEAPRYELTEDRIRALYGHSLPGMLKKERATPPRVLYHGTSVRALPIIRVAGLRPIRRQYVHLSIDQSTAYSVGRRKDRYVAILKIDSEAASADGVPFYVGNARTWLTDEVPSQYIGLV